MDYYNNQNVSPEKNTFANVSMILGICSLILLCTGVLSIALGAMGILFAVLSRKTGTMTTPAKTGCVMSLIGLVSGLFLTISFYILIFFSAYGDYAKENPGQYDSNAIMEQVFENLYGPDYESIIENSTGIDYDTLMEMLETY